MPRLASDSQSSCLLSNWDMCCCQTKFWIGICYGLDFKCLPKSHVLKVHTPTWEVVVTLGSGKVEGSEVSGGNPQRVSWDPGPFVLLGYPKASSFPPACTPHHDVLPCHRPKARRDVNQPQTETMNQNKNFFLLSCVSQVFCHSVGKLTYCSHPTWTMEEVPLRGDGLTEK